MKKEKAEALEYIGCFVRARCPKSNGHNLANCDECWQYPCTLMKSILTLAEEGEEE